jgi:hypothetical protein
MGSSLSSLVRITWSEHMGAQTAGGVMKLTEDRSELNLTSRVPNASWAKLESQP